MATVITGKTSWFGGPNDGENTGTALGLPDTVRGLAVYNRSTLGGYWRVHWPNGRVTVERQVDIGPAPWTNRKIDFTSAAIRAAGYSEKNFPTDSQATIEYLGKDASVAQGGDTRAPAQSSSVDLGKIFSKGLNKNPFSKALVDKLPTPSQQSGTQRVAQAQANQGANAVPTGSGVANFEGTQVAAWIAPILKYARQKGWSGSVSSGYRSFADQQRIYNSGVRPAARPGTSNHEGSDYPRGAVDVSNAEQLHRILRNSPYANTLVWAGSKDPVHFSHPHNGSY